MLIAIMLVGAAVSFANAAELLTHYDLLVQSFAAHVIADVSDNTPQPCLDAHGDGAVSAFGRVVFLRAIGLVPNRPAAETIGYEEDGRVWSVHSASIYLAKSALVLAAQVCAAMQCTDVTRPLHYAPMLELLSQCGHLPRLGSVRLIYSHAVHEWLLVVWAQVCGHSSDQSTVDSEVCSMNFAQWTSWLAHLACSLLPSAWPASRTFSTVGYFWGPRYRGVLPGAHPEHACVLPTTVLPWAWPLGAAEVLCNQLVQYCAVHMRAGQWPAL
jgi:hypothetical protein